MRGVTAAEYLEMCRDGSPTELVRGEIVAAPRPVDHHGVYCLNVVEELTRWSPRRSKGYALSNDTGVMTEEEPDGVRGPEALFLSKDRAPADFPSGDWLRVPPELAVEVKSSSESWPATRRKADEYLEAGVGEVWVLDGPTRQLRVHRRRGGRPAGIAGGGRTDEPPAPGFRCTVADLLTVG